MSLGEDLERRARAAGMWGSESPPPAFPYMVRVGPVIRIYTDAEAFVEIHAPEAILLVRLAALPPRVRRCPACEGDLASRVIPGGMTDAQKVAWSRIGKDWAPLSKRLQRHAADIWRKWPRCVERRRVRLRACDYRRARCPTCSEPGEPVECGACEPDWMLGYATSRTCRECSAMVEREDGRIERRNTGKVPGPRVPAGRVSTGWHEVWLEARPAPTGPWASLATGDPRRALPMVAVRQTDGSEQAYLPANPVAIADLHVLADHLKSPTADSLDELRVGLAESRARSDLGQALALWLAGAPCGECEGRPWERVCLTQGPCFDCDAHGTALAQHLCAQRIAHAEDPPARMLG